MVTFIFQAQGILIDFPIYFQIFYHGSHYVASIYCRYQSLSLSCLIKTSAAIFKFLEDVGLPYIAYIMIH